MYREAEFAGQNVYNSSASLQSTVEIIEIIYHMHKLFVTWRNVNTVSLAVDAYFLFVLVLP